jgi:hypothetical protein
MELPRRTLPPMARVRQDLPADRIGDVATNVFDRLIESGISRRISKGHRIAITAGSRGIGAFVELLSGIVRAVDECG